MNADALAWTAAAAVFAVGAGFVVLRRQLVAMVIGVELMVNAANILLVFTARRGDAQGLAAALLVLAAAAAEVVVGLTLILAVRRGESESPETGHLKGLAG